jgi:hypothetical protein
MAFVEGTRNNHVLSKNCCGFVQQQNRSRAKGFGTFACVVEAALQ